MKNLNKINKSKKIKSSESGITLVEVLVATLLLLIIIGPLLSFLRSAQLARSTSSKLTDVAQNARAAMLVIGRDIQNAGYNLAPKINLGASGIMNPLLGTETTLTPIVPGNDINLVDNINSTGTAVSNPTDQITIFANDQTFNNGLPVVGTISSAGSNFDSTVSLLTAGLDVGDFCVLSQGGQFAIGITTSVSATAAGFANTTPDTFGLNQPTTGPLSKLNPIPQLFNQTTLYRFAFVSYFVDKTGNLIRREQLPPTAHTLASGNMVQSSVTATTSKYKGNPATLYNDNIIATGVEDLQFSYYLADPTGTGVIGPVDDPGYYARTTNKGKTPTYRLLDIRRIKVSIKVRAQERDTKLRDPYNSKQGYLYRFSLEGTFNTRNFYGSNYRPITATN